LGDGRITGPVSSWNEWDPLEEVIVGTARGATEMPYEPALAPYYLPGSPPAATAAVRVPQPLVDQAERQLDAFAATLERLGIVVRRPDPVDHSIPFRTPDWEHAGGHATACPRDLLLVVADEILEAPMSQRGRFVEHRAYRTLLDAYSRLGARVVAAPKPRMTDALYERLFDGPRRDRPFDYLEGPVLTEAEPAFDAACFARFGRDLFWQPDLVSNEPGAEWLRGHLGPGFRVHRVRFRERFPTHIDTTLVPVRPGVVLVNPERPCLDTSMDLFAASGWRIVPAPPSVRSGRSPSRTVSNWISMNILMLDGKTAVVEAAEAPMADLLASLGCDVLRVPFDRVYPFRRRLPLLHARRAALRRPRVLLRLCRIS
jgi:glycine amidinotransferase